MPGQQPSTQDEFALHPIACGMAAGIGSFLLGPVPQSRFTGQVTIEQRQSD
eukprot:m.281640 g.281640  ORF g.281640 m.281640 type:complete len:51 (+) comp54932_c0_seq1:271-423(+)